MIVLVLEYTSPSSVLPPSGNEEGQEGDAGYGMRTVSPIRLSIFPGSKIVILALSSQLSKSSGFACTEEFVYP